MTLGGRIPGFNQVGKVLYTPGHRTYIRPLY